MPLSLSDLWKDNGIDIKRIEQEALLNIRRLNKSPIKKRLVISATRHYERSDKERGALLYYTDPNNKFGSTMS